MQICNETITALFVQTPDTIPCCNYSVKTYRDHWRKWNVSCYTAKSMEMEHKEIEIEIIIFVLLIHVMKSCVTLLELPSSVQSLKRTSTYCEQCYTSHYIYGTYSLCTCTYDRKWFPLRRLERCTYVHTCDPVRTDKDNSVAVVFFSCLSIQTFWTSFWT